MQKEWTEIVGGKRVVKKGRFGLGSLITTVSPRTLYGRVLEECGFLPSRTMNDQPLYSYKSETHDLFVILEGGMFESKVPWTVQMESVSGLLACTSRRGSLDGFTVEGVEKLLEMIREVYQEHLSTHPTRRGD